MLTQSVIIDITSTSSDLDGAVVATVPIGGNDEVWFDKGTRHYFLAARANEDNTGKVIPILGSIDAGTNKLDPSAPTSTTAHSVAADENAHNVFVPIGFVPPNSPAGTDATNPCPTNGCIAVFRARSEHSDDNGNVERQSGCFAESVSTSEPPGSARGFLVVSIAAAFLFRKADARSLRH